MYREFLCPWGGGGGGGGGRATLLSSHERTSCSGSTVHNIPIPMTNVS